MSKRNISYIKPEEPAFLKRMKEQIGYKEPEEILDAKRGPIENFSGSDEEYVEKDDEKPQVVKLKHDDLDEEEAKKFAKEKAEKPADLEKRIIFKAKKKKDEAEKIKLNNSDKGSRKKEKPTKSLLSFNDDEDS